MLSISIPMLGVSLSTTAIANIDILMLSAFTTEETVGIYSVYVKLTALISLGIVATSSMYAPKASRLYDAGKIKKLGSLTRQTSSLVAVITIASLVGILIFHRPILLIYGTEFLTHMAALYILMLALMINSFFGAVGVLLSMTGQQKYFFRIITTAALMNACLLYTSPSPRDRG